MTAPAPPSKLPSRKIKAREVPWPHHVLATLTCGHKVELDTFSQINRWTQASATCFDCYREA